MGIIQPNHSVAADSSKKEETVNLTHKGKKPKHLA